MSSALATLALALGLAAGSNLDERIVCVPSEDGKGWDCGRGADAPAPRALPREHARSAPSAPPPYLMDPSRIPSVANEDAAAYTPPEPPAAPAPAPAPEPVAAPEPAPQPVLTPEPTPAPEPVAVAEPAPVREPAPLPEPTPEPAAAPLPAPAPTPTPAPAPAPAPEAASPALQTAADLLSLPPGHSTIQLAGAGSDRGFDALRQQLGLSAGDSYAVRVRRDGRDWWLLLWRHFPDLASARAAATALGGGYWPRRLAPLQAEVQAAAAN